MAGRNKAPEAPRDTKLAKFSPRNSTPTLVDANSTPSATPSQEKSALRALSEGWKNQPVLSYYLILVTTLLLFIIGFILVFSASTITALESGANPFLSFGKRSLIYVAALLVLFIASRVPLTFYQKWTWWF